MGTDLEPHPHTRVGDRPSSGDRCGGGGGGGGVDGAYYLVCVSSQGHLIYISSFLFRSSLNSLLHIVQSFNAVP